MTIIHVDFILFITVFNYKEIILMYVHYCTYFEPFRAWFVPSKNPFPASLPST